MYYLVYHEFESEYIFTLDSLIKHKLCVSLVIYVCFSNNEAFQLSFEFHIQTGAEFHLSLHIVALLRGRPRCHVERNAASRDE